MLLFKVGLYPPLRMRLKSKREQLLEREPINLAQTRKRKALNFCASYQSVIGMAPQNQGSFIFGLKHQKLHDWCGDHHSRLQVFLIPCT